MTRTHLAYLSLALCWMAAAGLQAQSISKEYVYLGGRVIAVENRGLSIAMNAPSGATVGVAYSASLTVSGGTGPYTWSVAGALPPGVAQTPTTGSTLTISGTPTGPAGSYNVTITVTDSATAASATQAMAIPVAASALSITTTSLVNVTANAPYSATLTASGGTAPHMWTFEPPSPRPLPLGLTLSIAGAISGTTVATENCSFIVGATDSASPPQSVTKALAISVGSVLSITATSLPAGSVNVQYSAALAAAGGTGVYAWGITSGALRAGLSIGNGNISGLPTAAGTSTFTVTVTS